jgi:general secretion pathway protein I
VRFPPDRCGDSAGFSLIETLVALVVAGLAMAAIADAFGTGLLGHRASEATATALSLAEGQIAAASTGDELAPRQSEGVFADRYHWRLTVAPYDDRQKGFGFEPPASALRLYRIAIAVDWREGLRQRQLGLATLRLGRPPP